jgi:hypothetical protein
VSKQSITYLVKLCTTWKANATLNCEISHRKTFIAPSTSRTVTERVRRALRSNDSFARCYGRTSMNYAPLPQLTCPSDDSPVSDSASVDYIVQGTLRITFPLLIVSCSHLSLPCFPWFRSRSLASPVASPGMEHRCMRVHAPRDVSSCSSAPSSGRTMRWTLLRSGATFVSSFFVPFASSLDE